MSKVPSVRHRKHSRGEGYRFASEGHCHCGWAGVVGHAGARLLADVAEVTGLTAAFGERSLGCGAAARGMIRVGSRPMWR